MAVKRPQARRGDADDALVVVCGWGHYGPHKGAREVARAGVASTEKLAELHATLQTRLDARLAHYRCSDLVRQSVLRLDHAGRQRVPLRAWASADDRAAGAEIGVATLPLKWLLEEVLARRPDGVEELTGDAFEDIWFHAINAFHSRRLLSHAESGLELVDVDLHRVLTGGDAVLECIESHHPLDVDLRAYGEAMMGQWDDARLDASQRLADHAMGEADPNFAVVSAALVDAFGFSLQSYFAGARVLGNLPSVHVFPWSELVEFVKSAGRMNRSEAAALCHWLTLRGLDASGGAESSARDGRLLVRPLIPLSQGPRTDAVLVSPGMVLEACQYMFQELACGFFALPNALVPPALEAALGQLHQHLTSVDESRVAGVLSSWGWEARASVDRCADLGTFEKLSAGEIDVIAADAASHSIYVLELKDARSAHDGRTLRSHFLNRSKYESQLARKCEYVYRHADVIAGHLIGPSTNESLGGWAVRGCLVASEVAAWQYVVGWEDRTPVLLEGQLSAETLRSLPPLVSPGAPDR